MSVEISYRVINIARVGPSVKMVLEEVRTVPPEELKRAEAEAEPEIDVVDEGKLFQNLNVRPKPKTQMEEVFSAMRTQLPELMEVFKNNPSFPGGHGGGRILRPVPLSLDMEMLITPEQYAEMGSPPLLSTIRVTMSVE